MVYLAMYGILLTNRFDFPGKTLVQWRHLTDKDVFSVCVNG